MGRSRYDYHIELSCKRNELKKINSQLFCEKARDVASNSCIGELIEQIRHEETLLPENDFRERLLKYACPVCLEIWENKSQIKKYSKKIGIIKNKMHALAKRIKSESGLTS